MCRPFHIVLILLVTSLVISACSSSDPTASEEYQALEQELVQSEAQLMKVTAERDELIEDASAAGAADDNPSTDLTAEQEQMIQTIDRYLAAWNAGDGAAADEVMDPNGYLEDIGGRWYVADGEHARYLETLHATGFPIERSDHVAVIGNVVLMTNTYAEGSTSPSPNIYYMYPDGTKIWWVHEPYPLNLP